MKKQLVLTKNDDTYKLSDKSNKEKHIEIIDKVVNGEKLYEAFYRNVNEKIECEIENSLSEPADAIIYKQLKSLFEKIDASVNENCFNKKEEEKING